MHMSEKQSLLDEEISNTAHVVAEINQEVGAELVMHDEATLALFVNNLENTRNQHEFRERLEYTSIGAAIKNWLSNLATETARNYGYYMADMKRRGIMPEFDAKGNPFTIGHFRHVPHELVIDHIKKIPEWSESTRQVHAACYISFTAYLERLSNGWVRRALPSNLASNQTFFQIRDKCATKALTLSQWHKFIDALDAINTRDGLIARCMFQGAKRISEVLSATLEQVDFEKNMIRFRQSKTGGMIKEIPISYPAHFMESLKAYIAETAEQRADLPYLFVTRNGRPVTRVRLNYSFQQASDRSNLGFKVTPHMLRATWVTLVKQQGVQDTEIMKVTGHTSSKMVYAYDKTSAEDNQTKRIILI
jgi:integrase/recombinase XerD